MKTNVKYKKYLHNLSNDWFTSITYWQKSSLDSSLGKNSPHKTFPLKRPGTEDLSTATSMELHLLQ